MKHFAKLAATACIAILAAGPALADDFKRIRKEADFRAQIVGKTISTGSNYFVLHKNGTQTGQTKYGPITGNWKWNRNLFCRNTNVGTKALGLDCQVVKIAKDGTSVMFIREKGKGETKVFQIN